MRRMWLLVWLLLPHAAAAPVFLDAEVDRVFPVTGPVAIVDVDANAGLNQFASCQGSAEVTPIEGGFRFSEGPESAGCLEAWYDVDLLAPASRAVIRMDVDRQIERPALAGPLPLGEPEPSFLQEVVIAAVGKPQGTDVGGIHTLFGLQEGATAARLEVNVTLATTQLVSLRFRFADTDQSISNTLGLPTQAQAYASAVTNVSVLVPGQPLPFEDFMLASDHTSDGVRIENWTTVLEIPDGLAALHLQLLLDGADLTVEGPTAATRSRANATTALRFDTPAPGSYVLSAQTVTVLPVPPQTPPPDYGWVPILLFTLVMIGWVGTITAESIYVRLVARAREQGLQWIRAGSVMLSALGVALGILAVVWALVGPGWASLKSDPVTNADGFAYGALLVVAILLFTFMTIQAMYAIPALRIATREHRLRLALERSNRDLERFAHVASHDLQEPLRKVANFTELLAEENVGRLSPDSETYIQYAKDGAQRMTAMVRDLLAFSRVGDGDPPQDIVDLAELLAVVVADTEVAANDAGAAVRVDVAGQVRGSKEQLYRVFLNLMTNALRYRHPDRPPRIQVRRLPGRRVHLVVEDNGLGIPPDKVDVAFQMFRRLGTSGDGTGVGLPLARRIVEHHGGRLWIESDGQNGTRVHVELSEAR